MNISSISINRPVLAIVMSLVIILFGGIGYTFLGVREYPSIDPPVITVRTNYTGANADVIESQITPDSSMFYGRDGNPVHTVFGAFSTRELDHIVRLTSFEIEQVLLAGFNKRDSCDPVQDYKNVRRVGLAVVMSGE